MKKLIIIIGVLIVWLTLLIILVVEIKQYYSYKDYRYPNRNHNNKEELLLSSPSESQNQGSTSKVAVEKTRVTHIFDGDTIEIEGGRKVRLIGIDAPELNIDIKSPQCFATESAKITKKLLENQIVEMEKDGEDTDKYGRLLRYIYSDGVFVNEFLLLQGYARIMSIPPNTKYLKKFETAENEAKEAKRGLWGACY